CMGVGDPAAPGWPGTDWIEDILLHQSGADAYRQWAFGGQWAFDDGQLPWTDPKVENAWTTWLESYVSTVQGGPKAVLMNRFKGEVSPLLDKRSICQLDRRSSYALDEYKDLENLKVHNSAAEMKSAEVKSAEVKSAEVKSAEVKSAEVKSAEVKSAEVKSGSMVSADFAALVTSTDAAVAVLRKLAAKDTQEKWLTRSSGFPVDPDVNWPAGIRPGEAGVTIRRILAQPAELCLDASDLMPVTMRTAFQQAVLLFLQNPDQLARILELLQKVRDTVPERRLDLPCASAR
ncbi:MAG: hypothetical protein LC799_17450, partial [Actinobacteria bacterium]|nr:hypothetical protein [Actinomycetota bacterium]